MLNPEDISDPTTALDMALMLMVEDIGGNQFREYVEQIAGNQVGQNVVQNPAARTEGNGNSHNANEIRCYNCQGVGHYVRNCTVKPRKKDVAYLQTQLQIAQKEEAGIQLNPEEFDFMATAGAFKEIKEVNVNCTLKDGSAEVHHNEFFYDNDIFNMFTQEEQYIDILEPITEPHQVLQNDSNVISANSSVEHSGGNSRTADCYC
ncbi:reverse transcriptase domain-containing protein [Tanacetum coccineum]